MNRLRSTWQKTRRLALAAGGWAAAASTAWAQTTTTDSASQGGAPYALPYGIVILCVALGLFVVLHPSRRRERAKPETFADRK